MGVQSRRVVGFAERYADEHRVGPQGVPRSRAAYDRGRLCELYGGEETGGVNAAYGSGKTLNRLATIKQQVDPENLFCFNQNVIPREAMAV